MSDWSRRAFWLPAEDSLAWLWFVGVEPGEGPRWLLVFFDWWGAVIAFGARREFEF